MYGDLKKYTEIANLNLLFKWEQNVLYAKRQIEKFVNVSEVIILV